MLYVLVHPIGRGPQEIDDLVVIDGKQYRESESDDSYRIIPLNRVRGASSGMRIDVHAHSLRK